MGIEGEDLAAICVRGFFDSWAARCESPVSRFCTYCAAISCNYMPQGCVIKCLCIVIRG